jgi:fructokinase
MGELFYGAIEAGGTKFVCAVGSGPDRLMAEQRVPTTTPDATIAHVIDFFRLHARDYPLAAIGIGSFGPVDLEATSPHYGYITSTPKPGWRMTDLCGPVRAALGVPVAFDTDVNAAAFGEQYWVPAHQGLTPFLYVTVGTGIGVGGIVDGRPLHGMMHMEAGHFLIPHDPARDPFTGACPFHQDCWEGLASGPAMAKRWGAPAETLAFDHPGWALEAEYIGLAFANLVMAYSPRKIILGGGVGQHPGLLEAVRRNVLRVLNGYISAPELLNHMETVIAAPALGNRSGILGALALGISMRPASPSALS